MVPIVMRNTVFPQRDIRCNLVTLAAPESGLRTELAFPIPWETLAFGMDSRTPFLACADEGVLRDCERLAQDDRRRTRSNASKSGIKQGDEFA